MLRVINNKRVEMTAEEFLYYEKICRSYDRPDFKGEDLFKDLFETDKNGIIIFLKPPANSVPFTFEVYMFLVSLMVHQHLGIASAEVHQTHKEVMELKRDLAGLVTSTLPILLFSDRTWLTARHPYPTRTGANALARRRHTPPRWVAPI